jgi:hypothetical protein
MQNLLWLYEWQHQMMQSSSNVDLETKSLHAKRVVAGAEMIELVTTKTPKLRGSQNAEIRLLHWTMQNAKATLVV